MDSSGRRLGPLFSSRPVLGPVCPEQELHNEECMDGFVGRMWWAQQGEHRASFGTSMVQSTCPPAHPALGAALHQVGSPSRDFTAHWLSPRPHPQFLWLCLSAVSTCPTRAPLPTYESHFQQVKLVFQVGRIFTFSRLSDVDSQYGFFLCCPEVGFACLPVAPVSGLGGRSLRPARCHLPSKSILRRKAVFCGGEGKNSSRSHGSCGSC